MTHLLIGWRAGDLIVINGRGPALARPAEKCGHTIICPPNPFGTIHLLTRLARVFQRRSHYCAQSSNYGGNDNIIGSTVLTFGHSRASSNLIVLRVGRSWEVLSSNREAMEPTSFAEASASDQAASRALRVFPERSPSGRPCGPSDEPRRLCRQ
jgi:hypothetical protein